MAIGGAIASVCVTPASAFTLFFGEDVGANGNTNAIPNSKAAELSFLSNLTGSAIEGFEGIPAGESNSTTLSSVGATITATNALISGVSNITYDGTSPSLPAGIVNSRFPIAGSQYYEVGTFNGIATTTITFANPIAAFGFYATDVENSDGITLPLNDSANTVQTISRTTPLLTSGSALYYGLIAQNPSETFSSLTFRLTPVSNSSQGNDRFGLDNLTLATLAQVQTSATAVPEPFTIIGTTFAIVSAFQMRKKLKSENKL